MVDADNELGGAQFDGVGLFLDADPTGDFGDVGARQAGRQGAHAGDTVGDKINLKATFGDSSKRDLIVSHDEIAQLRRYFSHIFSRTQAEFGLSWCIQEALFPHPAQHPMSTTLKVLPTIALRRIATLAILALPVVPASAAVIVQTVNDGTNGNWNTRAIWGGPAATPTAGNDYVTGTGFAAAGATNLGVSVTGRIRDTGVAPFAGNSLTIVSGSELLLKNVSNATSSANIVLNGGVIRYAPTGGNAATLAGNLNVAAESYLGTNNGVVTTFTVAATLTGNSILHIAAGSGDASNLSSTISFTGNLSGFNGTFNLGGGTRTGGAKDATLDFGQDYFLPNVALVMGGTASADFLNLDQNLTFGSFSFASTVLSPGTYSAADLNTLFGNGGQFLDLAGTHTLTVVPEPGASTLLAGAGCGLAFLGRRRRRVTI